MSNIKPAAILCAGILIGLTVGQFLPSAQATTPETTVKTHEGEIVFVVKGRDIARIDAKGLHVTGDVEYTGTWSDTGAVKK